VTSDSTQHSFSKVGFGAVDLIKSMMRTEKENRKKVLNQANTFTEFNCNNVMTAMLLCVDICDAASEGGRRVTKI
jgi:hypothetical protein